jgi:hypothetical protein
MEFNPTWRLQPSETVSMHHLHNGEPDSTLSTMPLEYEIFETQSGKKKQYGFFRLSRIGVSP